MVSVYRTIGPLVYVMLLLTSDHYENMPMQYTANFHGYKNGNFQMKKCVIFLSFAQNIEAVLTSTHDLCFRAKIRKNVYPCKPHFTI